LLLGSDDPEALSLRNPRVSISARCETVGFLLEVAQPRNSNLIRAAVLEDFVSRVRPVIAHFGLAAFGFLCDEAFPGRLSLSPMPVVAYRLICFPGNAPNDSPTICFTVKRGNPLPIPSFRHGKCCAERGSG